MAINTKNVPEGTPGATSGDFVKSIIEPEKYKVKMNSIFLQAERNVEYGHKLIMHLETEPVSNTGFVGLDIDKNDPNKGSYQGRVGNVGFMRYSFRNWITPKQVEINREDDLLKAIKTICQRLGIIKWFNEDADGKYETVDDLIAGFNNEKPFKDIYFYACVGGREYLSKDKKYINYELFLVSDHRTEGLSFSLVENKVRNFFKKEMVEESIERPIQNETSKTESHANNEPAKSAVTSTQEQTFLNNAGNHPAGAYKQEEKSNVVQGEDKKFPWE